LLAFFLGVFCSEEIVGTILFYLRIWIYKFSFFIYEMLSVSYLVSEELTF
jgi:hypothetical protein